MSASPFTFTPEDRGFERVTDDDSDALYATDTSRDATGKVDRVEFAARGNEKTGFYAQKVERNEAGQIVGKQTFGTKKDSRGDAVESVEKQVRNRTAANFGGFEIGEFNVGDDSNVALARRAHLSRSEEAQASDAAKRAPVTTDASRYASQPGELDYPGVDTPSTDPNVLPKDLRQKQRPATTDPPERPTPRRDNDVSNPANDGILLQEEAEAGLGLDVGSELENPASVPVTPGSERRDSMVADGMGGVRFNANVGGYRETDRADEEIAPPESALAEQGDFLGIEQNEHAAKRAGVLDPEPDGSAVGDLAAGVAAFGGDSR